jgi:hypothetical protein
VSRDARLTEAATVQAPHRAEAGTLSHGRFTSRMSAFGINGHAVENLSAGSRTVDQVTARWAASPSHNENLSCRRRGGSVWRELIPQAWGMAATGPWCWHSRVHPGRKPAEDGRHSGPLVHDTVTRSAADRAGLLGVGAERCRSPGGPIGCDCRAAR